MMVRTFIAVAMLTAGVTGVARGQAPSPIVGTWRVDARVDTRGGPREVIIRADSSASWGRETSRWRVRGETIRIAIGGEWETYKLKVSRSALTLSGGDLQKPITLKRVGPATPRPAGVAVPPDPDSE